MATYEFLSILLRTMDFYIVDIFQLLRSLFFLMLKVPHLSPIGALLSWLLCPLEMTPLVLYSFLPF